jgi:hypothetical protein
VSHSGKKLKLICSYIGGRGGLCDNNRGGDLYMLSLLLEDMFSIYNLSSRSCRERSVYLKA